MWVRRIERKYTVRNGNSISKYYYYWYKSKRMGNRVISECIGSATEKEYLDQIAKKKVEQ